MSDYSELKRLADACVNVRGVELIGKRVEFHAEANPAAVLALIAEVEALRKDSGRFRFIEQDASSGMRKIYGDDWLEVVDQLIGVGDKP